MHRHVGESVDHLAGRSSELPTDCIRVLPPSNCRKDLIFAAHAPTARPRREGCCVLDPHRTSAHLGRCRMLVKTGSQSASGQPLAR